MFRKSTLLVGALALMLVAPQAHAHAAKGDVTITVGGGALIPLSEFKDFAKLGFLGGLDVDYMVTEAVAIGVDGMFSKNSAKKVYLDDNGLDKASQSFFSGGAHVKYMFPVAEESKIMPYVVGGGGIYHGSYKETEIGLSESPAETANKFGGHGGAGLNFKAGGNIGVGIEGLFHVVSTEGTSTKFVTFRGGVYFPLTSAK